MCKFMNYNNLAIINSIMKKIYLLVFIYVSFQPLLAQVGVNTTDPKAQLDIKASSETSPSNTDGILIPRVNAFPATSPTAAQQAMMIYLTTAVGANLPGFYYWNFATLDWISIGNNNSTGWNINGNAGTNSATNFIGTTDSQDVVFKRNNVRAGLLGPNNTALGVSTLNSLTTGVLNTAIGNLALFSNTSGFFNTATGQGALASNSTANFNTANGVSSLALNTTGSNNTAIGFESLSSNTFGVQNTANGALALQKNTTGSVNTANGFSALQNNTTGFRNTANGSFSLASNTTGRENTANGHLTLFSNTTGNGNIANGYSSLFSNTTGSSNLANGNFTLQFNTTGNSNTANGVSSLASNTTGNSNTANGHESLNRNTTGSFNTSNGNSALFFNTTGLSNTANGSLALQSNITGSFNSSLGVLSDVALDDLINATALGARATVGASNSLVLGSINGVNGATASVNVGIGTQIPLDKLHVVGNIRMTDGNQAAGKIMVSDVNGTATWQEIPSSNAWGLTGNTGTNPATNFIGTSDNLDLVLKTNDTDNFRIKNDGRIEIGNNGINPIYLGATSLSKKLFIATETATNNIVLQASNAASDPVSMYFGASRGNIATPTIASLNQNISNFFFSGYDGTKFVNSSSINARLDGLPGLNSMPGMLQFQTTPVGSSATITRMVIRSNGNIGIGTPTPVEKLHVVGNIRMVDGNQATGKVLTSDVNGTATWQSLISDDWSLTGNTGTNSAINFIGTSDDKDVIFKRFNIRAGLIGTNTSFGVNALNPLTTGTSNTVIGRSALQSNTTGVFNTANGQSALESNTTGFRNTANGHSALESNTTGFNNTANGVSALSSNTTGGSNTANGYIALSSNTIGDNNTATGYQALLANTAGINNTANGVSALDKNTTGDDNVAMGNRSLIDNVIGNSNTAIGKDALFNSTGNNNTAVGRGTLSGVTTGENNTAIGFDAQVANAAGDNQVRIGNGAVVSARVQVAWTITSDNRWKSNIQKSNLGLDFIKQLNPVFYTRKDVETYEGKTNISETTTNPTTEYGFIAQELESTLNKFNAKGNGIISKDDAGMLGVRYNDLLAPMVKAIQEQQVMIEELKAKIIQLENRK